LGLGNPECKLYVSKNWGSHVLKIMSKIFPGLGLGNPHHVRPKTEISCLENHVLKNSMSRFWWTPPVQANSRWPKTETVKNSTGNGQWWCQFGDLIAMLDWRPPASSLILAIEGLMVLDLVGKWQLTRGTKKETEVLTSFAATQCTTRWQVETTYVILGSKEHVFADYGHWQAFNTKRRFISTELGTSIWKYMDIGWVLVTNRSIMDLGWKYIHIANLSMTTSSILWDYWWKYILTLERFQYHMGKYMEIWKSLVTTRVHWTTSMEIRWKGLHNCQGNIWTYEMF
jgi:hypothetical protein